MATYLIKYGPITCLDSFIYFLKQGIVGHEFLSRGPDRVTRCPLVLQLHYEKDIGPQEEYAVFAEDQFGREKKVSSWISTT